MQTATEESLEIKPQQLNDFNIDLEFFSGPMDLLLHLVQQQEVSIEQVSMSVITRQYLEIVHRAQFLDIEKASEYLVIAATLLSIKSQSLLPSSDLDSSDLVEEERNEKFYEELREQLKAYQLAKARAQALINTPQLGVDTFTRIDKKSLLPTPEMLQEADDVNSLGLLFASLVKRIGGLAKSYKVRFENVTVVSYMMKIVDLLKVKPNSNNFTFKSLYQNLLSISNTNKNKNPADHKLTFREKTVVITSFGAILELVKRGIVNVTQENEAEDIKLQMRLKDVETSSLSTFQSDFDSSSDDKNSLSQNQLDSDAERFSSTDNKILKIANS